MARSCILNLVKSKAIPNVFSSERIYGRFIHCSPVCCEVRSGKVKSSLKKDKPVSYERALAPPHIGHRKSWNSWNTSTIDGGLRTPEIQFDDMFIRKFIVGTFHGMVYSEVIIKRQYNIIRIAMLLFPKLSPSKICFLIGYSEEILSYWLQCLVKLEIQTISSPKDVVFKYV